MTTKLTLIPGGAGSGTPPEDPPADNALAKGGGRTETEEAALRRALASFDDSKFQPEPLVPGGTSTIARDFYLRMINELHEVTNKADLRISSEFHALLWIATRLGGDQKFISQDQSVAPAACSRWVCAGQTPGREKRRGIMASALVSLDTAVEQKSVVPLITFTGKRAHVPSDPDDLHVAPAHHPA